MDKFTIPLAMRTTVRDKGEKAVDAAMEKIVLASPIRARVL